MSWCQQRADAAPADAGDAAVFLAFPEPAVMDEDGIGAAGDRGFEQRLVRGDARRRDDAPRRVLPLFADRLGNNPESAPFLALRRDSAIHHVPCGFRSLAMKRLWLILHKQ